MPTTPASLVELTEHVRDWKPADLRVDRERRLVRNVALTAVESRNGYRYTEEALRRALALYEGKPVFLDHAANVARPYDRSTRDLVGSIVHPRFEDGRVRGDIRVLDTDAGRTFLGLVESDSPAVGMSHVVLAERSSDSLTVERIHDVISVDAVVFPATAATFRESALNAARPETTSHPDAGDETGLTGDGGASGDAATTSDGPAVDEAARAGELGATGGSPVLAGDTPPGNAPEDEPAAAPEAVAVPTALLQGTWGPEPASQTGSVPEELDASLLESAGNEVPQLAAERDRLAAERDELACELESLRQELHHLREERAREQQEQEIERMLTESNLPPAVITEVFRRQLRTESDAAARQALVAERQSLVRELSSGRPHSRERPADEPPISDTRFITAIRQR